MGNIGDFGSHRGVAIFRGNITLEPYAKKMSDTEKGSILVILVILLMLLPFVLYETLSGLYIKYVLHYDKEKVQQICTYAKMGIYSCEELVYAANYCKSAREEACRLCGENCTSVILK
jgi:hypothetical protein